MFWHHDLAMHLHTSPCASLATTTHALLAVFAPRTQRTSVKPCDPSIFPLRILNCSFSPGALCSTTQIRHNQEAHTPTKGRKQPREPLILPDNPEKRLIHHGFTLKWDTSATSARTARHCCAP